MIDQLPNNLIIARTQEPPERTTTRFRDRLSVRNMDAATDSSNAPEVPGDMDSFIVGIIGMGDMGKMYARRLSAAGWR